MTPEAQRIAIAKACGWMFHPRLAGYNRTPETVAQNIRLLGHPHGPWDQADVPDYINDLNAMIEAISDLCKKKRLRCFCNSGLDGSWECILTESESPNCIPCDGDHYGASDTLCGAMREAFLRAIGKWTDE